MDNSRHIFIQIDTTSILLASGTNLPTNDLVSIHSIIYDQGSMVLGNPEKSFAIEVVSEQDVYFTILPLQLFSLNKIYFTKFEITKTNGGIVFPENLPPVVDGHQVSFKATIEKAAENGEMSFNLHAAIQYQLGGESIEIPICIDPVIRVKQGIKS